MNDGSVKARQTRETTTSQTAGQALQAAATTRLFAPSSTSERSHLIDRASWEPSELHPPVRRLRTLRTWPGPTTTSEISHSGAIAQLFKIPSSPDTRRPLQPHLRSPSLGTGSSVPLVSRVSDIPGLLDVQPSYRPTRSLLVWRKTSVSQLRTEAAFFGDVQQLEQVGPVEKGYFCLSFFDIRAAQACCASFNHHESELPVLPGSPAAPQSAWQLPAAIFIEPRSEDARCGSLLVSGQGWFVSAAEARRVCSDHGATCFVWGPIPQPHTPAHLVAFLDTRAARCAVQQLREKLLNGRRLLVERVPDPVPSYAWPAVPGVPSFLPVAPGASQLAGPSSPAARQPHSFRSDVQSSRGDLSRSSLPHLNTDFLSPRICAGLPSLSPAPPGTHHHYLRPAHPGLLAGPSSAAQYPQPPHPYGLAAGMAPAYASGSSPQGGFQPYPMHVQNSRSALRPKFLHGDPVQYQFDPEEPSRKGAGARRTLMIRNIPNKYTQAMLLEMLDSHSRDLYDFFYLPVDFKNRCNLGYAFVNFPNAADTIRCYEHFHGSHWEEFNSKKICEVTYARIQGREALIKHFRNSKFPNNDADCLPLASPNRQAGEIGGPLMLVPLLDLLTLQSGSSSSHRTSQSHAAPARRSSSP
ncbi:hypothetical protein WJX74_002914 [Apatococcus lobatus]|uniref:RRM domain-containing protein n=1 Tax=Apatococcus lobatus TaxID=904363 RepID=A0AAW1RDI5_9CHLO